MMHRRIKDQLAYMSKRDDRHPLFWEKRLSSFGRERGYWIDFAWRRKFRPYGWKGALGERARLRGYLAVLGPV